MNSLMTNKALQKKLNYLLPGASEVIAISAYVTLAGIKLLSTQTNTSNVVVVGRFTPADFLNGSSDIEGLRICLSLGYKVKALNNLHAKIYMVDRTSLFIGSANLTNNGFAIFGAGNLESCAELPITNESNEFIELIISSAIDIDTITLDSMEDFLCQYKLAHSNQIPNSWPLDIMKKSLTLFLSDFPLVAPGITHPLYKESPSLDFAQIEATRNDTAKAAELFKTTKVYIWVKDQLDQDDVNRGISFGQMSKLIHSSIQDDVRVYRKDIKEIQTSLYQYIKMYASDEVEIFMPGERSQVLRLV